MKLRFYAVDGKDRETDLAHAIAAGAKVLGDHRCEILNAGGYTEPLPGCDVVGVFGLKGRSKRIMEEYRTFGVRTLLFDKGLVRASMGMNAPSGYFRVSLDSFMPLDRIRRMMAEGVSPSRWAAVGIKVRQQIMPAPNGAIIYAGSSQKYCDFHGLGDEHEFSRQTIRAIKKGRRGGNRPVIYRPKPSFDNCRPIEGALYSRPPETLQQLLPGAYVLVTHGSHAAIDAILAGVPVIVLGEGAARPVAATDLDALADPYFPDQDKRFAWLSAIAHWQYKLSEMRDGTMWRFLRAEMERPAG